MRRYCLKYKTLPVTYTIKLYRNLVNCLQDLGDFPRILHFLCRRESMKGTLKRNLAFLLSVILVLTAIDHYHFSANADEVEPFVVEGILEVSGNDDVTGNENGDLDIVVRPNSEFVITGDFHANSIMLEASYEEGEDPASLIIFGDGRLTLNEPLVGYDDTMLRVEGPDNVPTGLTLYDADYSTPMTPEVDGWMGFMARYIPSEEEGEEGTCRWGRELNPDNVLDVFIDGMPEGATVTTKYSFTGTSFTGEAPNFYDYRFWGYHIEIPADDWNGYDPIYLQISIGNCGALVIADAGLGWDDEEENFAIHATVQGGEPTIDGSTFTYHFTDWDAEPRDIHLAMAYPNSGSHFIKDEVVNNIYAYDADPVDRLAEELYERYISVAMFESFGIANSADLAARISAVNDSSLPDSVPVYAYGSSTPTDYPVQYYLIDWGLDDQTGDPVQNIVPVITLSDSHEFLACRDFVYGGVDEEHVTASLASRYDSRISGVDEVPFSDDAGVDTSACLFVYNSEDEGLNVGGNGSEAKLLNGDGLLTFQIYSRFVDLHENNWGTKCRIIYDDETYIVLGGSGETKQYGGLGPNGLSVDNVWATGDGAESYVYIGDSTVYLEPLGSNLSSVGTRTISSVTVTDPEMAAGVTINTSNTNKITLTFASNFYDSVPLLITYSNGDTEELLLRRIGLVIQYSFLMDEGRGVKTGRIGYDDKTAYSTFTYDYRGQAGEQVIVYATYYHPTNDRTESGSDDLYLSLEFEDGTRRIISHIDESRGFDGYAPAESNYVATTSFIIGFDHSKEWDGNIWVNNRPDFLYKEGGFYATVLNAGFNDTTTYGGTQAGSGKGVYWDGHIDWFE